MCASPPCARSQVPAMRVGIGLVRVEGNLWQDASLHRIMALGWQCSTLPQTTIAGQSPLWIVSHPGFEHYSDNSIEVQIFGTDCLVYIISHGIMSTLLLTMRQRRLWGGRWQISGIGEGSQNQVSPDWLDSVVSMSRGRSRRVSLDRHGDLGSEPKTCKPGLRLPR